MAYLNRSETVRVDELSKLTNGVVFGLEKRINKPPISQIKADLWEILKSPCSSSKKKYSKNAKDWYTKSCFAITFYSYRNISNFLQFLGKFLLHWLIFASLPFCHSSCWFYSMTTFLPEIMKPRNAFFAKHKNMLKY